MQSRGWGDRIVPAQSRRSRNNAHKQGWLSVWQYSDYLSVSEDFIPVFSEDQDRGDNWKSFIPHAQMRDALMILARALERGKAEDKLSLWMMGAYGTGKTYASFVIKHILEDSTDQVEQYFQKHQIIATLWPRFRGIRGKGEYVVVYKSGCGEILSNRRLMIEVQRSIEEELKSRRLKVPITQGIIDQMISRLTDKYLNWEELFAKYRGRFLSANSAAEVIERLMDKRDVRVAEQVASVFEDVGFPLLDSADDVKAWIKSAIEVNNLSGVILIWDEFTEFFDSGLQTTPLQKLAEAAHDMPFYLFLITHKSLNQYGRLDEATRKWLQDRFHTFRLEMNPVTAYRLIANVIQTHPDRLEDWIAKRETLWSDVDRVALIINTLGESVRKEDLKQLLPMHPFSAYLLSAISSLYSSSQRTLFKFLKTNQTGSFQWFIGEYPRENWFWLTADCLWQYFFEETSVGSVDSLTDIITHNNSHIKNLPVDEARVFRVMMLLTALQRQTHAATELLNPRLSVLKRVFLGTCLHGKVEDVALSLCDRGLILAVPAGNDVEYTIPTAITDPNKLQQYRQRLETNHSFERMLDPERPEAEFARKITGCLELLGAEKLRHPVHLVSAKELRTRKDRVLPPLAHPYEVPLLLVMAQEDEHLAGLDSIALDLCKDDAQQCIFISQSPFRSKRWGEWLDCRSRALYYKDLKDETTAKYYDAKADGLANEWLGEFRSGRIRAVYRGRVDEMAGCESVHGYLSDIVGVLFPYGPEQIDGTTTLYDGPWGKGGAEIGLEVSRTIQRPYKDVVEKLTQQGVWDSADLEMRPNHPFCRMKLVVDNAFGGSDYVSLKELWESLEEPPYGLMPSAIGILLFSALLRPYSQGYYYSDNANSLPLNPNKLAELVDRTLKGAKYSETYTIRRMSAKAEAFCELVREVFGLPVDHSKYPEEVRKQLRKRISDMGFPLWAAAYCQPHGLSLYSAQSIKAATDSLHSVLAFDQDEMTDEQMECIVMTLEPVRGELPRRLTRERMESGMKHFIMEKAPRLLPLASSVKIDLDTVLLRIRSLMNEDVYLWREDRVEQKLPDITTSLDLTDSINRLCSTTRQDLAEAREYFRTSWFSGKFPLPLYVTGQSEDLAAVILYLDGVIYHPERGIVENRAEDIRRLSDRLRAVLSDDIAIIRRLVYEVAGVEVDGQEASNVLALLPDLTSGTKDSINQAITAALSAQARQKKVTEVRRLWKEATGFDSPDGWSNATKIPFQWLLTGRTLHTVELLNNPSSLSEEQLDGVLSYLRDHTSELAILNNPEQSLSRFVRVAAGDYSNLVEEAQGSRSLHDYVASKMTGHVGSWVMRLHEVNQTAKQWVTENYRTTVFPTVVRKVDSMPADRIKDVVRQLVSDALFGSRVLKAIEGERHTKSEGS